MAFVYDPMLGKLRWTYAAGPGIDISGGKISVITPPDGVPYVAGPGIGIDGATITNTLAGSGRISVSAGTASFAATADIVTVAGSSVTLQPDTAYKIYVTTGAVTLNAAAPPAGKWALDGHIELFVGSTGYVVTGSNVVLADALEPDAVNNCTVRYHDGVAIISVEDHVAGYIVVSASGTSAGSLPYGLTSATQEYIAFDATTDGTVINLSGATASGEKHIVGNGYTSTTLTGAVDCGASQFTVANLSLQDVVVSSGTLTLGDAFIPSGSTVAVSGGGLAVERVTGAGSESVVNLGGTKIYVSGGAAIASGCTFTGGFSEDNGGAFYTFSPLTLSGCSVVNCTASLGGGIFARNTTVNLSNSVVSGNNALSYGKDIYATSNAVINLDGSTIGSAMLLRDSVINLTGSNVVGEVAKRSDALYGSVTITSGAIVDLTGNSNPTPIDPGGGVIVDGGCQIITSAGTTVSIAGGTYTKINNDGTTE